MALHADVSEGFSCFARRARRPPEPGSGPAARLFSVGPAISLFSRVGVRLNLAGPRRQSEGQCLLVGSRGANRALGRGDWFLAPPALVDHPDPRFSAEGANGAAKTAPRWRVWGGAIAGAGGRAAGPECLPRGAWNRFRFHQLEMGFFSSIKRGRIGWPLPLVAWTARNPSLRARFGLAGRGETAGYDRSGRGRWRFNARKRSPLRVFTFESRRGTNLGAWGLRGKGPVPAGIWAIRGRCFGIALRFVWIEQTAPPPIRLVPPGGYSSKSAASPLSDCGRLLASFPRAGAVFRGFVFYFLHPLSSSRLLGFSAR